MKKRGFGLLAVLCSCGVAQANDAITAANNEIGLSVGSENIAYHEFGPASFFDMNWMNSSGSYLPPDGYLDSQTGSMPAFQLALSRQGDLLGLHNVYLSGVLTGGVGTTTYETYSWVTHYVPNTGTWETYGPVSETDRNFTVDGSLKLGKGFAIGQRMQVTPYVTFGGHLWNRNVSWLSNDYYWNLNAGAGVLAQYAVTPRFVVGADVAVLATFSAHAEENGVSFPLRSRPMSTGAITADYRVTKSLHLTASYAVQQIRYGASPLEGPTGSYGLVSYQSYEPDSRTITQTVMVGLAYSFR